MKTNLLCGPLVAGMLLWGAVSACGRPADGGRTVAIESDTLYVQDGRLFIRMTYRIRAAEIGAEEGLLLTPVIRWGSRERRFAPLLVNGCKRARRYARTQVMDPQHHGTGTLVTARKDGTIDVTCVADIPSEEWMRNSALQLEGLVCDCTDRIRHVVPTSPHPIGSE